MRVLRYHPRAAAGDGGMSNAIRRWAMALGDLGIDSAIASDDRAPEPEAAVEWIRVAHTSLAGQRIPRDLGRALAGCDLLVLHGGWAAHNVIAARQARRAGVPYLLEPRGAYDPHIVARRPWLKRAWWVSLEREVTRGARAVHLFFPSELPHLAALDVTTPTVIAPNGVDVPDAPTWDGGSGGYVLWYGRFDLEHKGVDALVEAVARLAPDRRPQLRLHGPDRRGDRARVEQRVGELGIDDWVSVGNPVYGREKEALLAACSAFAYPSRWEGFGIAPAEAVARGVPLLATPYPFARSLAERDGAIVVPADAGALADGLERVLGPDASVMAAAGRDTVLEHYRWPDVARTWLTRAQALL